MSEWPTYPPTDLYENREHCKAIDGGEYKVWQIDTKRLLVRGRRWHEMSAFHKRKFENLFVLYEPRQKLRFTYL